MKVKVISKFRGKVSNKSAVKNRCEWLFGAHKTLNSQKDSMYAKEGSIGGKPGVRRTSEGFFTRSEMILGERSVETLKNKTVTVFGIGGVGSYCLEALVRGGVGNIIIVDKDIVDVSNINRQLIATTKTVGKAKVLVAEERAKEINPDVNIYKYMCFYPSKTHIDLLGCDYIIDAIDTVSAKIYLAKEAMRLGIPIISSMGTGNKIDPTRFEIDDIYNTSVCPLCRVMRHELRKNGIKALKVVYSKEEPIKPMCDIKVDTEVRKKQIPGSVSFVPSVAGLIIAGQVIKDLLNMEG